MYIEKTIIDIKMKKKIAITYIYIKQYRYIVVRFNVISGNFNFESTKYWSYHNLYNNNTVHCFTAANNFFFFFVNLQAE